MTLGRRRIPRWANVLCWCWIVFLLGLTFYRSRVLHLDFPQTLGFFWLSSSTIVMLTVLGGIALYLLVIVIDFVRGRDVKEQEPEKLDSDIGNLVP